MRVRRILGLTLYTFFTVLFSTFILTIVIGYLLNSFNVVHGSKNISNEERQINKFTSIKNHTQFNIILKKSDSEKIIVSAENNLINKIITSVKNNELVIDIEKPFPYLTTTNIKNNFPIEIQVEYDELHKVTQAGSGYITNLEDQILESDQLELNVTGTGEINVNISANELVTNVSSVGSIKVSGEASNYNSKSASESQINIRNLKLPEGLSQQ